MPRDKELVLTGSPCTDNFYEGGPETVEGKMLRGVSLCPRRVECEAARAGLITEWNCVMLIGTAVARKAIIKGRPVAREVNEKLLRALVSKPLPALGYRWSPDRKEFLYLKSIKEILECVRDFAVLVLEGDLEDEWAAYRTPAQAEAPADDGEMMLIHRPDGKTELGILEF